MARPAKPITIDRLARMTQVELTAVRKDMAAEFATVRHDMAAEFADVRREMATKRDLAESEERLLDAIRGIEVRKNDFDALKHRG
jgi:hypothetical protein